MNHPVLVCSVMAVVIGVSEGIGFLQIPRQESRELVSEQDITMSLLEEVEGTLGANVASNHLRSLEAILKPMYTALPKNVYGNLGHASVRYALHRLFLMRHGWHFKNLARDAETSNISSPAGVLKDHMPAYLQNLFERRLGEKGFGLHDLVTMAATMEHVVHKDVVSKLGDVYTLYEVLPTQLVNETQADSMLDFFMLARIYGEDIKRISQRKARTLIKRISSDYVGWASTQNFIRRVKANMTRNLQNATSVKIDFATMTKIAQVVGEEFGNIQSSECDDLKSTLMKMDPRGSGRVRLGDFYKPGLDGNWQFQEKISYLRQIGALDESDPNTPSVVIVNYIHSYANCIISEGYYNVCCKDECEGLFAQLEERVAAPEATPAVIAALVEKLPSSTVSSPRLLTPVLVSRLVSIAAEHDGRVPLHGRLFAQWMHHAYPQECPYPHVSGTTSQHTPEEWSNITGLPERATRKEMQKFKPSSENDTWIEESEELPWSPEEELLIVHSQPQLVKTRSLFANFRPVVLFAFIGVFAVSLMRSLDASLSGQDAVKVKIFV